MKKVLNPILFICILFIGITVACNPQSLSTQPLETKTPTPTIEPSETPTPIPTPTETLIPVSPTPEFAPICESETANASTPSQCHMPIIEQSSVFCIKKVPYNLLLINKGASYEVLDENFTCSEEGTKNGKTMIMCTGAMAMPFEIRACDPACAIPTARAEMTNCPQDYFFDKFQGCCTKELQSVERECMVLKLVTNSCIVDCGQYTSQTSCNENYYACRWNDVSKVCQMRK